jgi:hypothetical protein
MALLADQGREEVTNHRDTETLRRQKQRGKQSKTEKSERPASNLLCPSSLRLCVSVVPSLLPSPLVALLIE